MFNPTAAEETVNSIIEFAKSLSVLPNRHEVLDIESISGPTIRHARVKHYDVLYTVDELANTVKIIRVISTFRDKENILNN